jgi:hypothetical protein
MNYESQEEYDAAMSANAYAEMEATNAAAQGEAEAQQANLMQVIPNSHRWHTIESLLYWVEIQLKQQDWNDNFCKKPVMEYLQIGLKNTIADGYQLLNTPSQAREDDK